MSDVVIRAEGLGKKYLIGHESQQERYTALRDVIGRSVKGFARSARDMMRGRQLIAGDEVEEFWALNDVNFEIKRGDVVGIIGRNGAGKSTLLKVLSRITEPSTGRVEIKGRVASLLEVGTGFHPELSGRENIFLNGAILGMSHAEIRRKFDEIVAFAEVEKFLDTPVKRYSSGMYVRLAFAVAAHLEPEILVVDEVLAVGDVEFQRKCLGKMGEVSHRGRTVIFVSHNLIAMKLLCTRILLLSRGAVALDSADVPKAIASYGARSDSPNLRASTQPILVTDMIRITDAFFCSDGRRVTSSQCGSSLSILIEYSVLKSHYPGFTVAMYDDVDQLIFCSIINNGDVSGDDHHPGSYFVQCQLPEHFMNAGRFLLSITHFVGHHLNPTTIRSVAYIEISDSEALRGVYTGPYPGVIRPQLKWFSGIQEVEHE